MKRTFRETHLQDTRGDPVKRGSGIHPGGPYAVSGRRERALSSASTTSAGCWNVRPWANQRVWMTEFFYIGLSREWNGAAHG